MTSYFRKDNSIESIAEQQRARLRAQIAVDLVKRPITVRFEPQVLDEMGRAAKATRLNKSAIVREAVRRHLARLAKEQAEA